MNVTPRRRALARVAPEGRDQRPPPRAAGATGEGRPNGRRRRSAAARRALAGRPRRHRLVSPPTTTCSVPPTVPRRRSCPRCPRRWPFTDPDIATGRPRRASPPPNLAARGNRHLAAVMADPAHGSATFDLPPGQPRVGRGDPTDRDVAARRQHVASDGAGDVHCPPKTVRSTIHEARHDDAPAQDVQISRHFCIRSHGDGVTGASFPPSSCPLPGPGWFAVTRAARRQQVPTHGAAIGSSNPPPDPMDRCRQPRRGVKGWADYLWRLRGQEESH